MLIPSTAADVVMRRGNALDAGRRERGQLEPAASVNEGCRGHLLQYWRMGRDYRQTRKKRPIFKAFPALIQQQV